ncbi:GNAT family N-acetyltransferase [Blastococcus sp. HT6-30]|uniref:GNAT family N-acetyltransferase n=1 Tax=Blastococcus sp. HT6-30 TaxID=3144843 RepID=UPI00321B83D9
MSLQLRRATAGELPAAAGILADAFTDYPWTRWTVAADDHDRRLTALQELYLTAVALPYGHVDLGCTAEGLTTVAVWIPGTAVPHQVWREIGPAVADLAGDRAAATDAADAVLAPHRPVGEHLLLAGVGVARPQQGRGLGAAALAPGLSRADRDRIPVHLETSAARNVRFYQRLGFTVTDVVDLPDGGPRTWLMHRAPLPAGTEPGATGTAVGAEPVG